MRPPFQAQQEPCTHTTEHVREGGRGAGRQGGRAGRARPHPPPAAKGWGARRPFPLQPPAGRARQRGGGVRSFHTPVARECGWSAWLRPGPVPRARTALARAPAARARGAWTWRGRGASFFLLLSPLASRGRGRAGRPGAARPPPARPRTGTGRDWPDPCPGGRGDRRPPPRTARLAPFVLSAPVLAFFFFFALRARPRPQTTLCFASPLLSFPSGTHRARVCLIPHTRIPRARRPATCPTQYGGWLDGWRRLGPRRGEGRETKGQSLEGGTAPGQQGGAGARRPAARCPGPVLRPSPPKNGRHRPPPAIARPATPAGGQDSVSATCWWAGRAGSGTDAPWRGGPRPRPN